MNEPWEANLAVLKSRHPQVASLLDGGSSPRASLMQVTLARSGLPTASVRNSAGASIHLASAYDPLLEAQQWVDEMTHGEWQTVAVLGLGLAYHVEELVRRFPTRRVVVIEPDVKLLRAALESRGLTALLSSPELNLVVTGDPSQAALLAFRYMARHLANPPRLLVWPPTQRLHQAFHETFQQALLDQTRSYRVNTATYNRFSAQWLVNFFANLNFSAGDPSVAALMQHFTGRPAIIVAAGPSLDRNVEVLREAKGRALIVAAGSAINPLLRSGIVPDLLLSIDPGAANHNHFKDLHSGDIPLVYVPTIFPRIVQEYRGPRWVAGLASQPFVSWSLERWGREVTTLASGPSVANAAWDLARQMGCEPIILVGQDLAYTDLKSHAEGAVHQRKIDEAKDDSRYFYVKDVHGGRVMTDRQMNAMRVWFEQRMGQVSEGRRTIDATEGGARIGGTEVMTLREALRSYCQERFDPYDLIVETYDREAQRLAVQGVQEQLASFLRELSEDLEQLGRIAWQAQKTARSLTRKVAKRTVTLRRYEQALEAFGQLDRDLSALPVFRMVIRPVIIHVVDSVNSVLTRRLEDERDLTRKAEQLVTTYASMFAAVSRTADQIQQLISLKLQDLGRPKQDTA